MAEKKEKATKKGPNDKQQKNLLGIVAEKEADLGSWYQEVIIKSEMIEYYDISGCYILRPWSYNIWEGIQSWFDAEIKKLGVKNSYFPLFVTQKALTAEKDHVEGFAPEVAWITKSGNTELHEPIAVRPTSETIMYPAYAQWIRSHRDLPLKLNQWNSVVRWEFKYPVPFIRSREFLWQEGHTAHATLDAAAEEVMQILDLYSKVYEELLAVPVIKGKKTEKEKFAGGHYTTTVEGFIPANGRGIQAATSHCLGQNFAKMFNITFEAEGSSEKKHVWQNSWGLTTRSIGIMVMVHGDSRGLVLPPRVAPTQVILVPLEFKGKDNEAVQRKAKEIVTALLAAGVRAECDDRTNYNPGWKYNHWEMKGVPIRLELGPKDLDNGQVVAVRRDNAEKCSIAFDDLISRVKGLLVSIHDSMLAKAKAERDAHIAEVLKWDDFVPSLAAKKMVLAPFCNVTACEESIKERTGKTEIIQDTGSGEQFEKLTLSAKSLCIPFDQKPLADDTKCFACEAKAAVWGLFGRSY